MTSLYDLGWIRYNGVQSGDRFTGGGLRRGAESGNDDGDDDDDDDEVLGDNCNIGQDDKVNGQKSKVKDDSSRFKASKLNFTGYGRAERGATGRYIGTRVHVETTSVV
jgi:hypothetical protein